MKSYLFKLFCLIIVAGCGSDPKEMEPMDGSWRLYDILSSNDNADFAEMAKLKDQLKEGSVLSFFGDNSYTLIDGTGNFSTGRWSAEDKMVLMADKAGGIKIAGIRSERKVKDNIVGTLTIERDGLKYKYKRFSSSLERFIDDPFYSSNNAWRIKAKRSEEPEELKKRLTNYFKHLALLLKAAKDREEKVVSFEFSQGPVKIYNGGIGIYPFENVPGSWKRTFFNEEESIAAYKQYEAYLNTTSYRGAAVGDWVEDDYNILLSIYSDFCESKPLQAE